MDVIHTTGSSVGARPAAVPFREIGSIRDRLRVLLRHPVRVYRRILEELPYDYPPAIIVIADVANLIIGLAAIGQRHSYFPSALPLLALVLLYPSVPLFCFARVVPHPLMLGVGGLAAVAVFLLQPASSDFAPYLLVVAAGEVAAIARKRVSAAYAAVAILELLAFDLNGHLLWNSPGTRFQGLPIYVVCVTLGWMVGVMLQYQRKYLYQEREYQEVRAAHAADEERRRIAREVHDVIAHSLSVTLLHLTAARHALQTDRDVDEAVDALTDAERLGRQAMADIRRTVGLLDARPSSSAPEPGLGDFDDLVGDFVRAGLCVRYECTGEISTVTAAVGLALYRIGQESLANVVKHAPGATVTVRLAVNAAAVGLVVDNTLPAGLPVESVGGMGLSGMRQRAELLGGRMSAGPFDDGWSVRAQFPLTPSRGGLACPVFPGLLHGTGA
ncbi:sensor histidine kinase [Nocardia sp. NPDC052566]|uniref:sensor histidine kinase n=1 Tax=Nocardia sp. NPDC052566 TaxID=3364330 RepID=UPI0037C63D46